MAAKVVVINSTWIKEENWRALGAEIQIILDSTNILADLEGLKLVDEFGIDCTKYCQFAFLYSIERRKRELERDKDEY